MTAQLLAGACFLLIVIVNVAAERFGYQTFSDLDAGAQLKKIAAAPGRFRIHFALIIIEHVLLVALAISLFVAFSSLNLALAVVWLVFRGSEGLVQLWYKRAYRSLLGLAERWTATNDGSKLTIEKETLAVLNRKNTVFTAAQILFSVGTLAYSVVFIRHGVTPAWIGWLGIAAGAIYGIGSAVKLIKDYKMIWNIGGLTVLVFELIAGGWLVIDAIVNRGAA